MCGGLSDASFRPSRVTSASRTGTFFFFQAEDGIRDLIVTGVQTCALPISMGRPSRTTVPEARNFVSALVQADRLGLPIANVLREQSHQMRLVRRQRAEEKADRKSVV